MMVSPFPLAPFVFVCVCVCVCLSFGVLRVHGTGHPCTLEETGRMLFYSSSLGFYHLKGRVFI